MNWTCLDAVGMVGNTSFDRSKDEQKKAILNIDFDNQELTVFENIPSGWTPIKAEFNRGYINILLKIKGKEYSFGFDTGFSGDIIFSEKHSNKSIKSIPNKRVVYGGLIQVAGGGIISTTSETKNVDKVFLTSDYTVDNIEMKMLPKNVENLVGLSFMQHYNWLLDYEEEKVYIQPRKKEYTPKEAGFYTNVLGAYFDESEMPVKIVLMVKGGNAEKSGLKIGDEVLSINGNEFPKISPCEIEDEIKQFIQNADEVIFKIQRNDKIEEIKLLR